MELGVDLSLCLKLLLLPSLGLVLLCAFLLDDCYHHNQHAHTTRTHPHLLHDARGHRLHGGNADITATQRLRRRVRRFLSRIAKCVLIFSFVQPRLFRHRTSQPHSLHLLRLFVVLVVRLVLSLSSLLALLVALPLS